jgi:hypothetical protein
VSDNGRLLAAAFHDDPMFCFIEPDDGRRRRVLPWFFAAAARLGARYGRLDTVPGQAAAVWLRPGATDLGLRHMVRSGLAVAPICRCYLETCSERNLSFYARHGFTVSEQVDEPGLPTFWTMVRRPSAS